MVDRIRFRSWRELWNHVSRQLARGRRRFTSAHDELNGYVPEGLTISEAVRLLGHEYAIYGTVERGIGLGRKLGYPTANVKYSDRKLLPPEGVYSCWTEIEQETKYGMMFIGRNHFNPIERISVEANLFDFDRDIYDQELIVYPISYIRPNQRFDSKEALIDRIAKDKKEVMKLFNKGERENAS